MKDFCKPVRSNSVYIGDNKTDKIKGWNEDPCDEYTTDNITCCFGNKKRVTKKNNCYYKP